MFPNETSGRRGLPPWGQLPTGIRLLFIAESAASGGWLAQALAEDSATRVQLTVAEGQAAGVARLREDEFDAVAIGHCPPTIDALELTAALRSAGSEEALLILGSAPEVDLGAWAFETGADGYACVESTTTRALLWLLARGIERQRLLRDARRAAQADRQRLLRERQEAERLLDAQRALVRDLELLGTATTPLVPRDIAPFGEIAQPATAALRTAAFPSAVERLPLAPELTNHYREMLRTYVIMGSGSLSAELSRLTQALAATHTSAQQALALHVTVLEELLPGLGARSARHVVTRADLLVLEVVTHLAEAYRHQACAGLPVQVQPASLADRTAA